MHTEQGKATKSRGLDIIQPKPEQAKGILPRPGQAESIHARGQAVTRRQSRTIEHVDQTVVSESRARTILSKGQAGTSESKGKVGRRNVTWAESTSSSSSRSTEQHRTIKPTEHAVRIRSLSAQANPRKTSSSTNLPNLKLSNFVDVQKLLHIGYRNPEFLPLIKRLSVVGELMKNFNSQVQRELVAMIKDIEKSIKELVYAKSTAYNSDAVQDAIYRILPDMNKSFCGIVMKQGLFVLDPSMRNLIEWKNMSSKLAKKKIRKKPGINLFDLSKRFQIKDLIKIGHDHPEFRTNVKTIVGVNAAMKHLNHEGQVEIYRILCLIGKITKDLVKEKTNPDGCHDIFLTPETLTSSLDYCIENILKCLKSPPKKVIDCLQCEMDRSYVRNVHIVPDLGTLKRPRDQTMRPQPKYTPIFEYANWGISPNCIQSLESLIHHLAARKGALKSVWLFVSCIDWFEIASFYSKYRSKTRQDMAEMLTLKQQILKKMDHIEKIIKVARDFCEGISCVPFTRNETLSDAIALSGQLEILASEVDYYFKMCDILIRELFSYKKQYTILSRAIRDNRLLFLTKAQWNAYDFPF